MFTSFVLISISKHTDTLPNLVLYPRDRSGVEHETQGHSKIFIHMRRAMLRRDVYRYIE